METDMPRYDDLTRDEQEAIARRAALRNLEKQYGLPSGLPQLHWMGEQWAAGNKVTREDADRHFGWRAQPTGSDTARITDGRRVVEGDFTPGHAESVADALNSRDLVKALGISLGLKVAS
jgi:hypothetical protein